MERFRNITRDEAWSYVVWGGIALVVGIPELWAAASGSGFYFPTISGTIGHLEALAPVVAVVPVASIAASAYALARIPPGTAVVQNDRQMLVRTPSGRFMDGEPRPAGAWPMLPYFVVSTVVIVGASVGAALSGDRWVVGYVLYSLIAAFWVLVPNWIAWRHRTEVPFATLFVTLRSLGRRVHFAAIALAAGLAVLLVHLALYPWPDLARESASYAGLTPLKAREKAERAVARPSAFSAEKRDVSHGRPAWFVYFTPTPGAGFAGCFVVVTAEVAVPSAACGG